MVKHFSSAGFLLFLLLFIGCGGQKVSTVDNRGETAIAEQRELIAEHIKDPKKQAKLMRVVDEVENESRLFFAYYKDHIIKVKELSSIRDASRDDFNKMALGFNTKYEGYLKMLVAKREEMRILTNEDEWKNIMNRETAFIPM